MTKINRGIESHFNGAGAGGASYLSASLQFMVNPSPEDFAVIREHAQPGSSAAGYVARIEKSGASASARKFDL